MLGSPTPTRARSLRTAWLVSVTISAAAAIGAQADAKVSYESGYGYERTWNAALRLVRVDLGLKVTEKDDRNGYLLFDYQSSEGGKRSVPGSIELIRPSEDDGPVRVMVQIPQMPRYHEQVMADELGRKLRQEYGEPRSRTRKPERPAPRGEDDGGAGDDGTPRDGGT